MLLAGALAAFGCDDPDHDHDHGHDHETEVINTVTLTFTPQDGGDAVVATFTDPDGDGGMSGSSDPIVLRSPTTYDLQIDLTNDLLDPVEDIGAEIAEEAEAHQLFITGMGVSGPAAGDDPAALVMHAYADLESTYGADTIDEDLPVGLRNTITAATPGTGTLSVRLQHLPPLNDMPQKTADLAERVAEGMALPGNIDASVEFELTVQ